MNWRTNPDDIRFVIKQAISDRDPSAIADKLGKKFDVYQNLNGLKLAEWCAALKRADDVEPDMKANLVEIAELFANMPRNDAMRGQSLDGKKIREFDAKIAKLAQRIVAEAAPAAALSPIAKNDIVGFLKQVIGFSPSQAAKVSNEQIDEWMKAIASQASPTFRSTFVAEREKFVSFGTEVMDDMRAFAEGKAGQRADLLKDTWDDLIGYSVIGHAALLLHYDAAIKAFAKGDTDRAAELLFPFDENLWQKACMNLVALGNPKTFAPSPGSAPREAVQDLVARALALDSVASKPSRRDL